VDINMEDNHKLYLEAANWIGTPYRGGGDSKRGTGRVTNRPGYSRNQINRFYNS